MKSHEISVILSGIDDAVISLLEVKDNRPTGMKRVEFIVGDYKIVAYKVGKTEALSGGIIRIEVTEI